MGHTTNLNTADGFVLSAYRADPAATPRGGLVVAQEIFGVNSHIRSVCDGFAADGYAVIAPALFDRYERGLGDEREPADRAARLTCFYSHRDNIVFPASAASLAGADNRHQPAVAHVHMVSRPEPWDETLRWLN